MLYGIYSLCSSGLYYICLLMFVIGIYNTYIIIMKICKEDRTQLDYYRSQERLDKIDKKMNSHISQMNMFVSSCKTEIFNIDDKLERDQRDIQTLFTKLNESL